MSWWQWLLLVLGTLALLVSFSRWQTSRYEMWTGPKRVAAWQAFVMLVSAVWCFGLVWWAAR